MKRAQRGEPLSIPASAYNAFVDAAEGFKASAGVPAATAPLLRDNPNLALVRNDSGGDIARFGVLGVDSPLVFDADTLAEFQGRVAVSGVTPTAEHENNYVVCIEPIPDGATGYAVISGVTPALLYVTSESDGYAAAAAGDDTRLVTGARGNARILWKDSGTGEKWAVVRWPDYGPAPTVVPATWHLDVDRHLNHGTLATSGATITADTDPQVDDTQDLFLNSIPQRRVIEFRGNVKNGTWAADMEKGESYCLGGHQNETYPVQGGTIVGASFWVAGPTDPPFVSGDLTFTLQYATLTDMETNSNANTLIALGPGLNISASTPAAWYKSLNIPIPDEVLSIEMNGYATSFAGNPHAFARVFIEDWPPAPFPVPTGGRTLKGFTAHMRNRFDTGCSIRVYPITQAAPAT